MTERARIVACLGVLFAVDAATVRQLRSLRTQRERVEFVQETIEEEYFANHPERLAETDKAWFLIHHALTGKSRSPAPTWKRIGQMLGVGRDPTPWDELVSDETYPLSHVILGGEHLHLDESYYIILKSPEIVADIARELPRITRQQFCDGLRTIDKAEHLGTFDEDLEYSWEYFNIVREFWLRVAGEERPVLFTVDL